MIEMMEINTALGRWSDYPLIGTLLRLTYTGWGKPETIIVSVDLHQIGDLQSTLHVH